MTESEYDPKILELAADDKSATEIAAILSLSPGFVRKRFLDPIFNCRLAEYKGVKVAKLATRSTKLMGACFDLLENVITGVEPAPIKERLTAAKIVLESSLKLRQESQYTPRLASLEAALKDTGVDLPPPIELDDE